MTRDEMRAKCIKAMEVGAHKAGHIGDLNELLTAAFDALHGIAWVIPVAATQGERPLRKGNIQNNDLTNPPEKRYDIGGGIMMSSRDFGESPERKP